jgi:hypothetical protein
MGTLAIKKLNDSNARFSFVDKTRDSGQNPHLSGGDIHHQIDLPTGETSKARNNVEVSVGNAILWMTWTLARRLVNRLADPFPWLPVSVEAASSPC